MHRTFEELGVTVDGVSYGHFTGEAQFDVTGQVVQIDIECENFGGRPLALDIDHLVRERIQLRRKYGVAFLEDSATEVRSHNLRFVLFQGLSDTLEARFASDIRQYIEDAKAQEPDRSDAA
jgi:hypothetical protein